MSTAHDTAASAYAAAWEEWHARHEAQRAAPHGFLAVTGLHWLDAEPTRLPDAPGLWSSGPDGVRVLLEEGESVTHEGRTLTGAQLLGPLEERGGLTLGWGEAVLEVARRGGADVLRPRHPDHPLRTGYTGTPTYPPSLRWVLPARFERYAAPAPTTVGSVVEGLEHVYDAVGDLVAELDGAPLRLQAFPGFSDDSLLVLFRDATSGVTTYPAVRALSVALQPDADGRLVVDLNRAVNLPCAYTPYATCPLPPAGNVLDVAVEAGERLPAA